MAGRQHGGTTAPRDGGTESSHPLGFEQERQGAGQERCGEHEVGVDDHGVEQIDFHQPTRDRAEIQTGELEHQARQPEKSSSEASQDEGEPPIEGSANPGGDEGVGGQDQQENRNCPEQTVDEVEAPSRPTCKPPQ